MPSKTSLRLKNSRRLRDLFCYSRWHDLHAEAKATDFRLALQMLQRQLDKERCDDAMVWSQAEAVLTRPDVTLATGVLTELVTLMVGLALLYVGDRNGRGFSVAPSLQMEILKKLEPHLNVASLDLTKINPVAFSPDILLLIEDWISRGAKPYYYTWIVDEIMRGTGHAVMRKYSSLLTPRERGKLAHLVAKLTSTTPMSPSTLLPAPPMPPMVIVGLSLI